MGVCAAPAVLVPESFRTLGCVAPSVNARTARAFLFIRLPALQYVYLSDYGSLRLRWIQEPDGPASLFCEAVVVYFLRARFRHPSNELNFSAFACVYLRRWKNAETVPARHARVHAVRFSYIYRSFGDTCVFRTAAMNESRSSMHRTYGATPGKFGPRWGSSLTET